MGTYERKVKIVIVIVIVKIAMENEKHFCNI